MTSIQLICKGGRARVTVDGPLNEGMRHVPVQITFDTAWDGLVPTLAAMGEKKYPMVVNAAGESEIPADALVAGLPLKLGVTGKSEDGRTVLPTYWVDCGKVNASPEGEPDAEPGEDPDPTVVEQIQALAYGADQKADDAKERAEEAKEAAQDAEQEAAQALEKAQTAEQIAKGAARAYVAETYAALDAWLREPGNAGKLQRGDNLYIVDKDVPDYWVVATLAAADPETGYWYRIAELETGKVDLDGYAKLEQLAPVALSGRYQDLTGKPEIPEAYDDAEIRGKIKGLEEDSAEIKEGLTQVEQLLPEAAPVVGKVLKVLSVNPDGSFVCEWADGGSGGVDVQINGTSITQDGVANIPLADTTKAGLVRIQNSYGVSMYDNGRIGLAQTSGDTVIAQRSGLAAVTLRNYDDVVRHAMADGIGKEWTAKEQTAAQQRLGINKEWALKGTLSGAGTLTVDFSGCTEFVIKGRIKATGNSNLNCNLTTLLYNGAAKADRSVYAHYIDCLDAIEPLTARHAGNGTVALGTSLTAYTINGKQVKDITTIYWAVPTAIDEATNLEVYAR